MKVNLTRACANKECGKEFKKYRTTDKFCSPTCKILTETTKPSKPTKRINKVSDKQKEIIAIYKVVRIEVLSEAKFKCFIDGCTNIANTVEHRMGRKGYADEWARENNIPLTIDKRYLAACCSYHNLELENNPELSKKYQLSKITGKPK